MKLDRVGPNNNNNNNKLCVLVSPCCCWWCRGSSSSSAVSGGPACPAPCVCVVLDIVSCSSRRSKSSVWRQNAATRRRSKRQPQARVTLIDFCLSLYNRSSHFKQKPAALYRCRSFVRSFGVCGLMYKMLMRWVSFEKMSMRMRLSLVVGGGHLVYEHESQLATGVYRRPLEKTDKKYHYLYYYYWLW